MSQLLRVKTEKIMCVYPTYFSSLEIAHNFLGAQEPNTLFTLQRIRVIKLHSVSNSLSGEFDRRVTQSAEFSIAGGS